MAENSLELGHIWITGVGNNNAPMRKVELGVINMLQSIMREAFFLTLYYEVSLELTACSSMA